MSTVLARRRRRRRPAKPQHTGTYRTLDLLDTMQLARAVRRTPLTVLLWRRYRQLPYIVVPGDRQDTIRFSVPEVRRWLRENAEWARMCRIELDLTRINGKAA